MASPKASKASVDYSKGMPSAHCSICRHFTAPNVCARVEGAVAPAMWCKLFAKGQADAQEPPARKYGFA